MNKKIVLQYLAWTFALALGSWGILSAFGMFGFTLDNAPWLFIVFAIGGMGPPIASYMALKKNDKVNGFKEWLRNVFAIRSPLRFYLLVILFLAVYNIPQVIFTSLGGASPFPIVEGLETLHPFLRFLVLLPMCLIGGGHEEAGWSYALRPELEKKFGFVFSSVLVAVIWALWHIPMYVPQGTIESLSWFGLFALSLLGGSFALGAIIKITKNVWLCLLFHTLDNAIGTTLYGGYTDSLIGQVISTSLLILVSVTAVFISERKSKLS